MSIVRNNLMTQKNYTPYCGNIKGCSMPRTKFNGKQFDCPCCKWQSMFEEKFITEYKTHWGIK